MECPDARQPGTVEGPLGVEDRDKGTPRGATPPTPPPARHTRPAAVKRGQRRRRKSSPRQRVERLSLLRRAYDHHRDLCARLPAAAVASPSDRARQFMTLTPLSPSP